MAGCTRSARGPREFVRACGLARDVRRHGAVPAGARRHLSCTEWLTCPCESRRRDRRGDHRRRRRRLVVGAVHRGRNLLPLQAVFLPLRRPGHQQQVPRPALAHEDSPPRARVPFRAGRGQNLQRAMMWRKRSPQMPSTRRSASRQRLQRLQMRAVESVGDLCYPARDALRLTDAASSR